MHPCSSFVNQVFQGFSPSLVSTTSNLYQFLVRVPSGTQIIPTYLLQALLHTLTLASQEIVNKC